jgi:hypothetical protein
VKQLNLALKFLLELGALAAVAVWGVSAGDGLTSIVYGVAAPLVVAVLWGAFAAPRARRRLPLRFRVPFELGVFALAAAALWAAASPVWAAAFACVVLLNALLLTVFDQWEA